MTFDDNNVCFIPSPPPSGVRQSQTMGAAQTSPASGSTIQPEKRHDDRQRRPACVDMAQNTMQSGLVFTTTCRPPAATR